MTELADIFQAHGGRYQSKYGNRILPSQRAAIQAILACRTEVLGGHIYVCQSCDETQYSYHSCQNRHCPKCQHGAGQEWLEKQQALLLPVPYFLLTFTLPSDLRQLARSHQKTIYNLLFRASASATQELAQDPRFVGGTIGMIGILHTWGRNLAYHPHVHYLVPAGALSPDGKSWVASRHNFFVPVRALSKLFRAKFRDALQQADIPDKIPANIWCQDWVVHCQPVGTGQEALRYLAPYIFRVAISNRRILRTAGDRVTFQYTATETGKPRRCVLSAEDFIHRFLHHVLPRGFVKVRYYGFFSPSKRKQLQSIWLLLAGTDIPSVQESTENSSSIVRSSRQCPRCGDLLMRQQRIWPGCRWPQAP